MNLVVGATCLRNEARQSIYPYSDGGTVEYIESPRRLDLLPSILYLIDRTFNTLQSV